MRWSERLAEGETAEGTCGWRCALGKRDSMYMSLSSCEPPTSGQGHPCGTPAVGHPRQGRARSEGL